MLGNAWEWVAGGEPARRTLRGGSFVDFDPIIHLKRGASTSSAPPPNHAITPATRMETTQDSGSVNTSFRCASAEVKRMDTMQAGEDADEARDGAGAESDWEL